MNKFILICGTFLVLAIFLNVEARPEEEKQQVTFTKLSLPDQPEASSAEDEEKKSGDEEADLFRRRREAIPEEEKQQVTFTKLSLPEPEAPSAEDEEKKPGDED